jgi:hypothetical protein
LENEEEEEEEEEDEGIDNGVIFSIRPSSLIATLSSFLTSPSYSPPSPSFVSRERDSFIIGVTNNDDDDDNEEEDDDDEEEEDDESRTSIDDSDEHGSIDDDLNNFLLCEC